MLKRAGRYGLLLAGLSVLLPASSPAQEAGEAYRARLLVSGFLLRSALACKGPGTKQAADTGLRYAATDDLRDFSQAYPKTAKRWMLEGAGHFNEDVMKKGLRITCANAMHMAREAP